MPRLLIERSENVATPFTALSGVVPESVPEPGLLAMARAIDAEEVVTTRPEESSTLTTTEGVKGAPVTVFEGWAVKISCVATFEMSKVALVTEIRPELDAVRVTPEA